MSQSTNGLLVYGYDLGSEEKWKVREWDDEEYVLNVPWIDSDAEEVTDWGEALARQVVTAWNAARGTTYNPGKWSDQEDVLKLAGIEFETYCSDSYPMYVLCAAEASETAYRGKCIDVTGKIAASRPAWDEQLAWALAALGMTPLQGKPAWLLCSYADGF